MQFFFIFHVHVYIKMFLRWLKLKGRSAPQSTRLATALRENHVKVQTIYSLTALSCRLSPLFTHTSSIYRRFFFVLHQFPSEKPKISEISFILVDFGRTWFQCGINFSSKTRRSCIQKPGSFFSLSFMPHNHPKWMKFGRTIVRCYTEFWAIYLNGVIIYASQHFPYKM